jgi:hypothetical protein
MYMQLYTLQHLVGLNLHRPYSRGVIVKVIDIADLEGSALPGRWLQELVGQHPVVVVATKVDLLPRHARPRIPIAALHTHKKQKRNGETQKQKMNGETQKQKMITGSGNADMVSFNDYGDDDCDILTADLRAFFKTLPPPDLPEVVGPIALVSGNH